MTMDIGFVFLNIGIGLACLIGMEGIAWLAHRFIMHGILWNLHKDHHVPHKGKFEKNDLFVIFFASPAIVCLVLGINQANWPLISAGIGITLYGILYTLFHDIMFHRRSKWLKIPAKAKYFKRIVAAHRAHHRTLDRYPSDSFGFLWAPKKYEEEKKDKS